MPPMIQTQHVIVTVNDLLHTLTPLLRSGPTPFTGKQVHFVGIGGTGMSGLAHMRVNFGALVSGTDRAESAVTRRLSGVGVKVGVKDGVPLIKLELRINMAES